MSLHRSNERTKFVTSSGCWAVVIDRSQVVALEREIRRKSLNGRPESGRGRLTAAQLGQLNEHRSVEREAAD